MPGKDGRWLKRWWFGGHVKENEASVASELFGSTKIIRLADRTIQYLDKISTGTRKEAFNKRALYLAVGDYVLIMMMIRGHLYFRKIYRLLSNVDVVAKFVPCFQHLEFKCVPVLKTCIIYE